MENDNHTHVDLNNGWYSHPNIGLMRVYKDKGTTKYQPIRKFNGKFFAMKPNTVFSDIAKDMKVVPLPSNHPSNAISEELKSYYHSII